MVYLPFKESNQPIFFLLPFLRSSFKILILSCVTILLYSAPNIEPGTFTILKVFCKYASFIRLGLADGFANRDRGAHVSFLIKRNKPQFVRKDWPAFRKGEPGCCEGMPAVAAFSVRRMIGWPDFYQDKSGYGQIARLFPP